MTELDDLESRQNIYWGLLGSEDTVCAALLWCNLLFRKTLYICGDHGVNLLIFIRYHLGVLICMVTVWWYCSPM